MTRGLSTGSRFSPGNLSPEVLESTFVGRGAQLSDILLRIERSATKAEKHFVLLIGPRGIGKTHFLSLVAQRVASSPQFSNARPRLCVAHLNEEEWGVASYLDLLVRVLRAIAIRGGEKALTPRLERVYDAFKTSSERALSEAEHLLIEVVGDRVLLVLCENLTDLLDGIGDEGQRRWRAFIQEHPFWTIVATAQMLSPALSAHDVPFYNFFTIRKLQPLDLDGAVALVRERALAVGDALLAAALDTPVGRARMRAIHHLAGGNHRACVVLADFLDKESLDELVTPFLRMVDDLTPYYQDRMRTLAPAQRKIVEHLCLEGRPMPVKAVASRCLMSPQTAAKQLGELEHAQYVTRTRSGRETFYEVAEPLMRICVDVKDNRTEHLRLFVTLLRHWFSANELRERYEHVARLDPGERRVDRLHLAAALREQKSAPSEPFLEALAEEARRCEDTGHWAKAATAYAKLAHERGWVFDYTNCAECQMKEGRLDEALETISKGMRRHKRSEWLWETRAEIEQARGRINEALRCVDRALEIEPRSPYSLALRSELLREAERFADAEDNDKHVLDVARSRELAWLRVEALLALGRNDAALREIDKALARGKAPDLFLPDRCYALLRLGRFGEVVQCADALLAASPAHVSAVGMKAYALRALGRDHDAESVLREAVDRAPGKPGLVLLLSETLAARGARDAAWLALKPLLGETLPVTQRLDVARVLSTLDRHAEAIRELDAVLAGAPDHTRALPLRAHARLSSGATEGAVEDLLHAGSVGAPSARLIPCIEALQAGGHHAAALKVAEHLHARDGDVPQVAELRAWSLLNLGRYEEALAVVQSTHLAEAEAPQTGPVALSATTAVLGLVAGVQQFVEATRKNAPGTSTDPVFLVQCVLEAELVARGPASLARQIGRVRETLVTHQLATHLAAALTAMVSAIVRIPALFSDPLEWLSALPLLEAALSDDPECAQALRLLTAYVHYRHTNNASVLLTLPKELRSLLLPPPGNS